MVIVREKKEGTKMKSALYKQRKNKLVCGVCAGIADKFGLDLPLIRVLTALLILFSDFGIVLYILLAICLPYKEDVTRNRGTEPRRRKDAEVVDEDDDNDGWFW